MHHGCNSFLDHQIALFTTALALHTPRASMSAIRLLPVVVAGAEDGTSSGNNGQSIAMSPTPLDCQHSALNCFVVQSAATGEKGHSKLSWLLPQLYLTMWQRRHDSPISKR